jgi:hypothetical protein
VVVLKQPLPLSAVHRRDRSRFNLCRLGAGYVAQVSSVRLPAGFFFRTCFGGYGHSHSKAGLMEERPGSED